MNQRFQSEEIKRVSEQYAENELYKAISTIGPQLESELKEFGLCPEECLVEVLDLLSIIADKGEEFLPEINNIWLRKSNDYRRLARQVERVNEEEISKAVGIVFGFTILAIDSSTHPFYRYILPEQLMQVVANHKFDDWQSTFDRIFSVPLPDGWYDAYFEEEYPVPLASLKKAKTAKPKRKVNRQANIKPKTLKYYTHGNNSILMRQRKRVDIVFSKWIEWKWIDEQTTANDFDSLFEGEPKHCNLIWKANSTILTILLQELLKQPYIEVQIKQSASSMVREQFGITPNSDKKRLDNDDKFKIEATLFLLNISNPLPLREGGSDNDQETTDAALKAVLSRELRITKGI